MAMIAVDNRRSVLSSDSDIQSCARASFSQQPGVVNEKMSDSARPPAFEAMSLPV